jgi:hypothetical protein
MLITHLSVLRHPASPWLSSFNRMMFPSRSRIKFNSDNPHASQRSLVGKLISIVDYAAHWLGWKWEGERLQRGVGRLLCGVLYSLLRNTQYRITYELGRNVPTLQLPLPHSTTPHSTTTHSTVPIPNGSPVSDQHER